MRFVRLTGVLAAVIVAAFLSLGSSDAGAQTGVAGYWRLASVVPESVRSKTVVAFPPPPKASAGLAVALAKADFVSLLFGGGR